MALEGPVKRLRLTLPARPGESGEGEDERDEDEDEGDIDENEGEDEGDENVDDQYGQDEYGEGQGEGQDEDEDEDEEADAVSKEGMGKDSLRSEESGLEGRSGGNGRPSRAKRATYKATWAEQQAEISRQPLALTKPRPKPKPKGKTAPIVQQ